MFFSLYIMMKSSMLEKHWKKKITECGFTLKSVRDMIKAYIQIHGTDKYSQHSSIIWLVGINDWIFVYELTGYI